MRHFEAPQSHFRQDPADPAHFVLVRTCKGHIHLDITNSSTSQAPASSSHFSRIPRSCSPPAGPCGLPDPQILPLLVPRAPDPGIPGFPPRGREIPDSLPRRLARPARQDSRPGAGIPASGQESPPAGREFPPQAGKSRIPRPVGKSGISRRGTGIPAPAGPPRGPPLRRPFFNFSFRPLFHGRFGHFLVRKMTGLGGVPEVPL